MFRLVLNLLCNDACLTLGPWPYCDDHDSRVPARGLIQRLIITRVPVLIGDGVPLFGTLPRDIRLRHVATRHYPSGLVQGEYDVAA